MAFSQEQFLGRSYLWKITIEQGRVSFLFYVWNVFFFREKEISALGSAPNFPSFAISSCPKPDHFASPGPEILCLVAGLADTSAWRVYFSQLFQNQVNSNGNSAFRRSHRNSPKSRITQRFILFPFSIFPLLLKYSMRAIVEEKAKKNGICSGFIPPSCNLIVWRKQIPWIYLGRTLWLENIHRKPTKRHWIQCNIRLLYVTLPSKLKKNTCLQLFKLRQCCRLPISANSC